MQTTFVAASVRHVVLERYKKGDGIQVERLFKKLSNLFKNFSKIFSNLIKKSDGLQGERLFSDAGCF